MNRHSQLLPPPSDRPSPVVIRLAPVPSNLGVAGAIALQTAAQTAPTVAPRRLAR